MFYLCQRKGRSLVYRIIQWSWNNFLFEKKRHFEKMWFFFLLMIFNTYYVKNHLFYVFWWERLWVGRVTEWILCFLLGLYIISASNANEVKPRPCCTFFTKKKSWNEHIFLVPGGDIWMIFSWMHACIQRYLGLRWLEQVSYFIHIFRQITFCYFQNGRVFEVHSSKIEYSICNHFCPRHDKDGFGMTLLVKCPEDSKIQNLGGTVNKIGIDYLFQDTWTINFYV